MTDTKPNIVIILADDMGWMDVGYHGSEIRTPNLDMYRPEDMTIPRGPLEAPIYSIGGTKDEDLQRRRAIYAAMVTCMDDCVGRIVESLRERGMAEKRKGYLADDCGGRTLAARAH